MPKSRCYRGLCMEGLRRNMKNLNHTSRCSSRDLNLAPPEYKSRTLSLYRPGRSTIMHDGILEILAVGCVTNVWDVN
jgi:hypothetical protein